MPPKKAPVKKPPAKSGAVKSKAPTGATKGKTSVGQKGKAVPNKTENTKPSAAVKDPKKDAPPPKKKTTEEKKAEVIAAHKVADKDGDMKGAYGKKIFAQRLMKSMLPLRWFLSIFGHFPMVYREDKPSPKGGTYGYTFTFSWMTPRSVMFLFVSLLSVYALIIGVINFAIVVLTEHVKPGEEIDLDHAEYHAERFYETALIARHLMWTMSVLAATIHSVIVCYHIFVNRHYIPTVYTFQSKVTQQLHMDASNGILVTSLILILIYMSTIIAAILMAALRFSSVTTGIPTIFGALMFRLFVRGEGLWIDHQTTPRSVIQILGGIYLIIIYTSSKCQILMFIYHCKLLRNAFSAWNGRVYLTMMKAGKYFLTEEGRTTLHLLYKDHCILLDLLEGTNRTFATIIESYYALQMATIFFELYFFLRTAKYGDDIAAASEHGGSYFIREHDWLPGLFLTVQSIALAFVTSKVASDVGEEAMACVDILRRKIVLYRKTDDELYFHLSLQESMNAYQRFDVFGGGYDYLNKIWIMGYINNIMGYFIILYQFQPLMDYSTNGDYKQRRTLGEFFTNLENLPVGHWRSTPPPLPITYVKG